MKRKTTLKKERKVIREFHKQLRSGKDLDTNSMYQDAGKTCFLSCKQAGNIIRNHYKAIINEEMSNFINQLNVNNVHHEEKVILFAEKFSYCMRESRLIINYIIRK